MRWQCGGLQGQLQGARQAAGTFFCPGSSLGTGPHAHHPCTRHAAKPHGSNKLAATPTACRCRSRGQTPGRTHCSAGPAWWGCRTRSPGGTGRSCRWRGLSRLPGGCPRGSSATTHECTRRTWRGSSGSCRTTGPCCSVGLQAGGQAEEGWSGRQGEGGLLLPGRCRACLCGRASIPPQHRQWRIRVTG